MDKKNLDIEILRRMSSKLNYNCTRLGWSTFTIDHEGRDYHSYITDRDRIVTVYILMKRFKRRCYDSNFNMAIAVGMSYKLTPERALSMSRQKLMKMMRIFSMRSRAHYYNRFALAGIDPRGYDWPKELSHHQPYSFELGEVNSGEVIMLEEVIKAWFHLNLA